MGSTTFGFLTESFLFNDENIEDRYTAFSNDDIRAELRRYREHIVSEIGVLKEEIARTDGRLKYLAERDLLSTRRLMQSALYIDQIILPDPLFPFTTRESRGTKIMNRLHNMPSGESVDRTALARAARTMKDLTPMVAADYVKFFPLSYLSEPEENPPVVYSETGFADVLPPDILRQYRERADVRSLRQTDTGLTVEDSLALGRRIAIGFRDHYPDQMMLYELFRTRVTAIDEESGIVSVVMDLPDEAPTPDHFATWVTQSIHQTARHHANDAGTLLGLAGEIGSSYLTGSSFTYSLLQTGTADSSIEQQTADCVLNFDLPYLDDLSMPDLMSIRNNEEVFHRFRVELEKNLRSLRAETDQSAAHVRVQEAMHELSVVRLAEIERQMDTLKKRLAVSVLSTGLGATVLTGGASIAAMLVALINGCKTYADYRTQIAENPSYFLWRARTSRRPWQARANESSTGQTGSASRNRQMSYVVRTIAALSDQPTETGSARSSQEQDDDHTKPDGSEASSEGES